MGSRPIYSNTPIRFRALPQRFFLSSAEPRGLLIFDKKEGDSMWTARQTILISFIVMLIVAIRSGAAISAGFPEKPIEFTVPFAAEAAVILWRGRSPR